MTRTAVVRIASMALGLGMAVSASPSLADCWAAGPFSGYTAPSNENYTYAADGMARQILICFAGTGGTVTGDDLTFTSVGDSTLIGIGTNAAGLATVEVYQIDRQRHRALYARSRIGTSTASAILPDLSSSFIGPAEPWK